MLFFLPSHGLGKKVMLTAVPNPTEDRLAFTGVIVPVLIETSSLHLVMANASEVLAWKALKNI